LDCEKQKEVIKTKKIWVIFFIILKLKHENR
jgi:hypothetical protein